MCICLGVSAYLCVCVCVRVYLRVCQCVVVYTCLRLCAHKWTKCKVTKTCNPVISRPYSCVFQSSGAVAPFIDPFFRRARRHPRSSGTRASRSVHVQGKKQCSRAGLVPLRKEHCGNPQSPSGDAQGKNERQSMT